MSDRKTSAEQDDEMMIDTSGMNEEQRAAMEVAEAARDQAAGGGFAQQLFMGQFRPDLMTPFPSQSRDDRETGDVFVKKVSAFLREHLDPEEVDATRTIPQEVIDGLVELGVFAMKVPAAYGGLEFSQVNYNRVMMAIASYCGSTAVLISAHQSIGVPQPLKLFGTEEQKRRHLPRFRKGDISAFALTEPDVGSDPAQMKTRAVLSADGTHYLLNGLKLWCTNGPIANVLVVMAQTAPKIVDGREKKQITAFIVEGDWPGVEVVHRCDFMGIRGIQNGVLRFTDVVVPVENVIWEPGRGLKLALATLNTGRLTLPAACTGAAKQCLSFARRWGNQRVQWGSPIGLHEEGRQKIAYIAATTFAMDAVTWLTSHWADRGDVDIRIEAAMAKLFCSEAAWKIVDMTMQLRGGRGYEKAASLAARGEEPYPVERIMRETRINTIIEGTSEVMRLFLAREALDPHFKVAGDLLRPGLPPGRKARAILHVLGYYAHWYPRQWLNAAWLRPHSGMGRLARHYRYLDRAAHRVARVLFHAMARYGPGLEKRQIVLGSIMEIGTELFAMAATCSYATQLERTDEHAGAVETADAFCRQARRRIRQHLRGIRDPVTRSNNRYAAKVLEGDITWLEDGVMFIGKP
jgi:alkylation response protein AidB-like acyl-CoA dehydrogenase